MSRGCPRLHRANFGLEITGRVESLLPYLPFPLSRCPGRSRVDELLVFSGLGDRWCNWRPRSLTSEEREEVRRAMSSPVSGDEGQEVPRLSSSVAGSSEEWLGF